MGGFLISSIRVWPTSGEASTPLFISAPRVSTCEQVAREIEGKSFMCCKRSEVPKPPFAWMKFGRGIVVALCDLLILLVVAVAVWFFFKYFMFHGAEIDCGGFNGENWGSIIKATAWPVGSFITIFLFRNPILRILYEIPWFVRRSWYRAGGDERMITIPGKESENVGSDNEDSCCKHPIQKPEEKTKEKAKAMVKGQDMLQMEHNVLMQLQREYGVPVLREMGIENSRFFFDGVMEVGNKIYAIEVKTTADERIWRRTFERMAKIYSVFSTECKDRFVFMVCIAGNLSLEMRKRLEQIAKENSFQTLVRCFPEFCV